MEIERKFLVKEVPEETSKIEGNDIVQFYLNFDPEIRIRRKNKECFHTTKSTGDLKREETERNISEEEFDMYSAKMKGIPIIKTRYDIELENNLLAELDIYDFQLKGLKTVEVEFKTEEDAINFNVPTWFGEELTYDKRFKNKNLAQMSELETEELIKEANTYTKKI